MYTAIPVRRPLTIITLIALLLLAGCAASSQNNRLRSDLTRVEVGLQDLRTLQADHAAQISGLEGQLREVLAELERIQYSANSPSESSRGYRAALGSQRSGDDVRSGESENLRVSSGRTPPPIVPAEELEMDEELAGDLPPEPGRILRNALRRVREGAYREALPLLDQGQQMSGGMEWQAPFIFWRGVCLDGMGDNPRALAAYHELITGHPRDKRVALALLRQASVFIRLGDSDTARLTLQKLISDFPSSQEARRARERLESL